MKYLGAMYSSSVYSRGIYSVHGINICTVVEKHRIDNIILTQY